MIELLEKIKFWDEDMASCSNVTLFTILDGTELIKKFKRIPKIVIGDWCMDHFLAGCTSFNQALVIPDTVNGKNCLGYFMQGCTFINEEVRYKDALGGINRVNELSIKTIGIY